MTPRLLADVHGVKIIARLDAEVFYIEQFQHVERMRPADGAGALAMMS